MSQMTMTTNHGPIVFEMFDDDAPKTVDNFRKLSTDGRDRPQEPATIEKVEFDKVETEG